jgi:hypothetical protein
VRRVDGQWHTAPSPVNLEGKKSTTFRGFMIMAEVDGERGHGYFVPAVKSKKLAGRLDCAGLPTTCPDTAACQVHGMHCILVISSSIKSIVNPHTHRELPMP